MPISTSVPSPALTWQDGFLEGQEKERERESRARESEGESERERGEDARIGAQFVLGTLIANSRTQIAKRTLEGVPSFSAREREGEKL
jgi:hypothetical protein